MFSIAGHPHPKLDQARKLFVTELALEGEHDKEWRERGRAVPAEEPYAPPRRTQKPVVHGIQSAIVTGPRGRDIFTDEHGRVRAHFPWDREGHGDDQSSCWIRVSQGWAGAGFGLWTLPRVGQEVLVGFLAGDPDEPIIVGRAPNAHNPPPYPLPAHETKTVWRSRSTPDGDGFNEISFEDKKGDERLYERAEKDKESLIKGDEKRLRPVSGYAGLGILESPDNIEAGQFQPVVRAIAERFPGLEVENRPLHTSHLVEGIKGVNWLTVLGDRWIERAGGLDSLRARLDESFVFYGYEGGVIIQAGPKPQVGDVKAGRWPAHYVTLSRVLKHIQIKNHYPFHFGGEGRLDHNATLAWLFRFDGK